MRVERAEKQHPAREKNGNSSHTARNNDRCDQRRPLGNPKPQ